MTGGEALHGLVVKVLYVILHLRSLHVWPLLGLSLLIRIYRLRPRLLEMLTRRASIRHTMRKVAGLHLS